MGPTVSGHRRPDCTGSDAYWDDDTDSVKSPLGRSPRIFPIPLYDPDYYQSGKVNGRNATLRMMGWIGFFVEGLNGNEVYGRICPILGRSTPMQDRRPKGRQFPLLSNWSSSPISDMALLTAQILSDDEGFRKAASDLLRSGAVPSASGMVRRLRQEDTPISLSSMVATSTTTRCRK